MPSGISWRSPSSSCGRRCSGTRWRAPCFPGPTIPDRESTMQKRPTLAGPLPLFMNDTGAIETWSPRYNRMLAVRPQDLERLSVWLRGQETDDRAGGEGTGELVASLVDAGLLQPEGSARDDRPIFVL